MKRTLSIMLGVTVALLVGGTALLHGGDPDAAVKPVVSWWGAHSEIAVARFARADEASSWNAIWLAHRGKEDSPANRPGHYNPAEIPEIDFEKCTVVAVFQGKTWNSAGVKVVAVTEQEDHVLVRFDDNSYQTMEHADEVTPYGIFVLPRTSKPIILEDNVQGLIGSPPKWKRVATLKPTRK